MILTVGIVNAQDGMTIIIIVIQSNAVLFCTPLLEGEGPPRRTAIGATSLSYYFKVIEEIQLSILLQLINRRVMCFSYYLKVIGETTRYSCPFYYFEVIGESCVASITTK